MSKGITESVIEEIKSRIDLVELISSYGIQVKSAGATKKACCPFHHEKTPSFNINESKGFYHCFGCGESGDAIKFVQKQEGLTFVEAVKKLAEQCGVKIEEKEDPTLGRRKRLHALMAELAAFYHRCLLKTKEAQLARDYLVERALGEETQENYLIGYAPNGVATMLKWAEKYGYTPEELEEAGVIKAPRGPGDRGYHRFGGRLMFTIRDKQGRAVGFSGRQLVASKNSGKYVNSPETPIFKKANVLYGFDKAAAAIAKTPNHEVIVCEGQIDCIRLQTSGFPNAVAGQGTAFTEEHVRMLKRVSDQVVFVYDDDAAGHKATIRSARLCLAAELPVRVVSLPGGDDPDSFLRSHKAEDFRRLLDNAESIMAFQVRAERAKETNPDSIDAMTRISKALLATIASATSAVIRAGMTGEAAKLTGLPSAALTEELGKIKVDRAAVRTMPSPTDEDEEPYEIVDEEAEGEEEPIEGARAADVIPPPPGELAFCAFLMAHEYDEVLDGEIGEFLPPTLFAHAFTTRFVDVWRQEKACGEDLFAAFAEKLSNEERSWFDGILLDAGKANASALKTTDIMHDFIRSLWIAKLTAERGLLPAIGDETADRRRLELSLEVKRLARLRWPDVKDFIRTHIKGDN